jgi:hypothetical protein
MPPATAAGFRVSVAFSISNSGDDLIAPVVRSNRLKPGAGFRGYSLLGESQKLRTLKRFLAIAAVGHVAFVLAVFLVVRSQLAPQTINQNGSGISFAPDTHSYRIEAEDMAKLIWQGKLRDWTRYNATNCIARVWFQF